MTKLFPRIVRKYPLIWAPLGAQHSKTTQCCCAVHTWRRGGGRWRGGSPRPEQQRERLAPEETATWPPVSGERGGEPHSLVTGEPDPGRNGMETEEAAVVGQTTIQQKENATVKIRIVSKLGLHMNLTGMQ